MDEGPDDTDWLTLEETAAALGLAVTRVQQMVRDGGLAGRRDVHGTLRIPADFVQDGAVVKGLSGVITLLRDAGYADEDAVRWLHTPDESLPGTPVDALRSDRGKEVKRRAQALGF